jgi:hypothetical protein
MAAHIQLGKKWKEVVSGSKMNAKKNQRKKSAATHKSSLTTGPTSLDALSVDKGRIMALQ